MQVIEFAQQDELQCYCMRIGHVVPGTGFLRALLWILLSRFLISTTDELALAREGKERAPQEPRAKELPYVIDCPATYEVRAHPTLVWELFYGRLKRLLLNRRRLRRLTASRSGKGRRDVRRRRVLGKYAYVVEWAICGLPQNKKLGRINFAEGEKRFLASFIHYSDLICRRVDVLMLSKR